MRYGIRCKKICHFLFFADNVSALLHNLKCFASFQSFNNTRQGILRKLQCNHNDKLGVSITDYVFWSLGIFLDEFSTLQLASCFLGPVNLFLASIFQITELLTKTVIFSDFAFLA